MPNMPWFRFYSEALNDRKIARAVRMSQQPKAIVIGVWLTLLCLANDSPERGKLMIADDMWLEEDEILAETGLDPITFGKIIKAFQTLNMVTVAAGYEVLNWGKRQYKSDNSSERVAKWRAKNKVTDSETLPKRYSNALDTDTEQNRVYVEKKTHTRTPRYELPDDATPYNGHQAQREEMVAAIAGVVKTTLAIGMNSDDFERVADALISEGMTPDQVGGFGKWWKKNGHYEGKPALKSLLGEIKNVVVSTKEDFGDF